MCLRILREGPCEGRGESGMWFQCEGWGVRHVVSAEAHLTSRRPGAQCPRGFVPSLALGPPFELELSQLLTVGSPGGGECPSG